MTGKSEPDNTELFKRWYNMGVDFSDAHEYEKALMAYDQALTFDDKDPSIWINRCYILNQLNRFDEAVNAGNMAIQLSPQNYKAWDNLCDAYNGNKNREKADECKKNMFKIKNLSKDSSNSLKIDNSKQDNIDLSILWYNRGNEFSESKDYEKALMAYDQAIFYNNKDPDVWNNKSSILNILKRYDEALQAGNMAVQLSPQDPELWDTLCNAYIGINDQEKADECQKKIFDLKNRSINSFSLLEKGYDREHLNVIYGKCIGKSVYYFNIILIWSIIGIDFLLYFFGDHQVPNFFAMIAVAVSYYWITPSGIRRVYNKSLGSRTASNIACLLCFWLGIFGWLICWGYENW